MRVVKDMMKESYGRPFFVYSERNSPCTFWQWGDVQPSARPMCRHGFSCAVLKVKKRRRQQGSCVFQLPKRKGKLLRLFRMGSRGRRGINTAGQLIRTQTVEIKNKRARELF